MANYDFLFNIGHGQSEVDGTYDSGAYYNGVQEHLVAEQIVDKAISLLKTKYGMNNIQREEQNYKDVDLKGNTYKYPFAISLHINAGGGQRAEIFVPMSCSEFKLQENILQDLSKLGLNNGGIKSREYFSGETYRRTNGVAMSGLDYYKEIRDAKNLGINLSIYEVGFIDSNDINIILNNLDKIAAIFADRIAEYIGLKPIEEKTTPSSNEKTVFRVVAGSFADRKNAEVHQNKLKAVGYSTFLDAYVKDGKTYFRVVAGSFGEKKNAEKVVNELKVKGFETFIAAYNNSSSDTKVTTPTPQPQPVTPAPQPAPQPQKVETKKYLNLHPYLSKWNVYKTNVAPVSGNQCGALNPKYYGGLSYEILGNPQADVYTISTSSYGKVNIYAPRDNDSSITTYKVY